MTVAMLSVPIGTVIDYAGSSTPAGYLECDGSAVSRTTYSKLYAAIGTAWGVGDGSTTFNLPDFRGRTAIGAGTGTAGGASAHALASKGGDERLQSHNHTVPQHGHGFTQPKGPNHRHSDPSQNIHARYVWNNAITGSEWAFVVGNTNTNNWSAWDRANTQAGYTGYEGTGSCTGGAVSDKAAFPTESSGGGVFCEHAALRYRQEAHPRCLARRVA